MDDMQLNFTNFDLTVSRVDFVMHKSYPTDYVYKMNFRQCYGFVYVISGSALYDYGYKQLCPTAGDVLFLRKGDCYTIKTDGSEPWESICVSFSVLRESDIDRLPFDTVMQISHGKRYEELFCKLDKKWQEGAAGYKLIAKGLVSTLIYDLMRDRVEKLLGQNRTYQGIKAAAEYMETNYKSKITVLQLADISGYSTSHFSKLFSEVYGVSPIQYLNDIRINHAKNYIKSGSMTLSEIAEECGFSNIYYFSRMFKQSTGCTPKKY